MPKKAKELQALAVSRIKSVGMSFVGGVDGLALQVTESGAKSWILRVMVAGKRRHLGLGGYPAVTLQGAQEAARAARVKVRAGIDPIEEGRAARSLLAASRAGALTFEQCAARYINIKSPEWVNLKHIQQWSNTLETYAFPVIGELLVRDVDQPHIMQILEPIWNEKTETAVRLRGRLEKILDWATVSGYRTGLNPARWKGHLDTLLARPKKVANAKHFPALPFIEIGAFMVELRKIEGISARALEFAILNASRSGEVRGAAWSEIDFKARAWTIPAARMKQKVEHRVPLTDEAIALLKAMPRIGGIDLIFPNTKGTGLSDMALTATLRRMDAGKFEVDGEGWRDKDGRTITQHGFRSTFRDWSSERTSYDRNTCEMALAHAIGDAVEAAYRRGDLFEKRTRLMRDWGKFCGAVQTTATVTAIKSKRGAIDG
jgi:integrase